jgi:outer membrane protein OmpA-like peptidoglycan-associated protein
LFTKKEVEGMLKSTRFAPVLFSLFILFFIGLPLISGHAVAQDKFVEVEELLSKAREDGAELLSPKNLRIAEDEYKKAMELREKGKSLSDINKRLDKSKQFAQSVLNNIKLAEVTFTKVFPVRDRAIKANAEKFVPVLWSEAEKEFRGTVIDLEEGKVKHAKEMVTPLIDQYDSVELEAIKEDIMGSARVLSTQIEKEVVPDAAITYQKGIEKINETDNILDKDRYAREEAEAVIAVAEYELRHAQSLALRVEAVEKKDMESIFLGFEENLKQIADGLGADVKFDGELKDVVSEMASVSSDLVARNREMSSRLYSMKEEMVESAELKESLEQRLEEQKKEKERLSRVQSVFKTSEVKVRLVGFTFPTGTATVKPDYFDLLSRVQEAIGVYPEAKVVIEGHTDSMGDEGHNKTLSQKRADAIQQYLISKIDPSTVKAVGYGEERPIATNESAEGRALNRRVEVVIIP